MALELVNIAIKKTHTKTTTHTMITHITKERHFETIQIEHNDDVADIKVVFDIIDESGDDFTPASTELQIKSWATDAQWVTQSIIYDYLYEQYL